MTKFTPEWSRYRFMIQMCLATFEPDYQFGMWQVSFWDHMGKAKRI